MMKPCLVAAAEDDAVGALHAQGAGRRLGRRLAGRRARRRAPRRRDAALQLLCSTTVQVQSLSEAASIKAQQDCDWTCGNDNIRKRRQNQPACGNLTEQSRIRDPRTASFRECPLAGQRCRLHLSPPQFTPTTNVELIRMPIAKLTFSRTAQGWRSRSPPHRSPYRT